MDIFDKREILLDLSIAMLDGERPRNDEFLTLIDFEDWLCNSGLSGFAQTVDDRRISVIENFALEQNFELVATMASVMRQLFDRHGKDFIDKLNENEYEELCQHDDAFYGFHDTFTDTLYKKYIENNI